MALSSEPSTPSLPASGPAPQTGTQDYLYLGRGGDASYVLTYPHLRQVGTIGNAAFGLCADAKGNVFLTTSDLVQEYAPGATQPFKVLKVPGGYAVDCSVDAASGNLAVAVLCLPCGYDDRGNIFLSDGAQIRELPKGRTNFVPISFEPSLARAGTSNGMDDFSRLKILADMEQDPRRFTR
jgi:hypothetical protein